MISPKELGYSDPIAFAFLNPYLGAGLSWGGLKKKNEKVMSCLGWAQLLGQRRLVYNVNTVKMFIVGFVIFLICRVILKRMKGFLVQLSDWRDFHKKAQTLL